jgi:heparosan-N-sulfate-glucuronate 5-epimerase
MPVSHPKPMTIRAVEGEAIDEVGLHHVRTSRFIPGQVEQAIRSAFSRGPGYEPTPVGTAYSGSGLTGYYIDFRSKTHSQAASETQRILPAALAQLALGWWERSIAGEDQALDAFLRLCETLVGRGVETGAELRWPMPIGAAKYRLEPGACSALAQGQAASVLVRAYLATGEGKYAEWSQRAISPLLSQRSSDLVSITSVGPVLEEVPSIPASHILNGWIAGLWGIRDVFVVLSDDRCRRGFEAGVDCLRLHLPAYDVGWWSRYSLYPHVLEDLAKPIYHRYHTDQLRVMYTLTGACEFKETADRWASYDRRSQVVLLLMQKGLFAAADGRRRRRWVAAGEDESPAP